MSKAKEKYPQIRIRTLCQALNISKNSYYNTPEKMRLRDLKDLEIVSKYFERSKEKSGIRQLVMIIRREEDLVMNHKKVARLKKKHGLHTKIRIKNKYRQFAKKVFEHESCPNLLERNFKNLKADQVYSTDVTMLRYGGKRAYLAAVKDLETKEIVGSCVSTRIDTDLTNTAMKKALGKLSLKQRSCLMVHSDQGLNFTHVSFRSLLQENGVIQSMSRKGNCLDNAPIESFFGLLKDHLDLRGCVKIEDVEKKVTRAINYYNNERPQTGLKKMPPTEYRRHFY